jgi:hypothetical protein
LRAQFTAEYNAKLETERLQIMADAETADLLRKHGGKMGAELKAEGK